MTEALNLSLAAAILDVNLKGPTATFDEMGLAAVRSAWLAVRAHLDTELLLGPGTPPDTSWNKRASPPGGEWRWVPVEPTEEMLVAAGATPAGVMPRGGIDRTRRMLPKWWSAMLSAAPPREAVGVGIEGSSVAGLPSSQEGSDPHTPHSAGKED